MSEPILFAHRGGARGRRENTLPAFRAALELGATGLETDVRITADGVPVLHHDPTIRIGLRRRPLAALDRDRLPQRVATFTELLDLGQTDTPLSIDLKDPGAFPATVEVARAAGALGRLWLCSPDPSELGRWRAAEPEVHLCLSAEGPPDEPAARAAQLHALVDAGADVVNYRARSWNRNLIERVHAAGLAAFAWDANSRRVLGRVLDLGIDGVYADRVGWLVATVRGGPPRR